MYKYAIYSCNGLRGCVLYDTHAEALAAARLRTNLSHSPWIVSAIKVG